MRRLLRKSEVAEVLGLRPSRLDELVAEGRLPRPVIIIEGGRAVGFPSDEIERYVSERIAARDAALAVRGKVKEKSA